MRVCLSECECVCLHCVFALCVCTVCVHLYGPFKHTFKRLFEGLDLVLGFRLESGLGAREISMSVCVLTKIEAQMCVLSVSSKMTNLANSDTERMYLMT